MTTKPAQPPFSGVFSSAASRALIIGATFVLLYMLLASLARYYMVRPFAITPWNPSAGLALAFLLICGIRYWPALAIAAVTASLVLRGIPSAPYTQLLAPCVLTIGYIGMAALLSGPLRFRCAFDTLGDILKLSIVAAIGTLLIAMAYVAVFSSLGHLSEQASGQIFLRFWIGHLIGIVINTPLLLLLMLPFQSVRRMSPNLVCWETVAQLASMALVLWIIFGPHWGDPYKLFYLLFLPVIWIAMRHGIIGAVLGIAILQIGLIVALVLNNFQSGTAVTEFQFMMLALAVAGHFLGMIITENRDARMALDRSESRLRTTVSTASDCILTVDAGGTVLAANPATSRIFACAPEALNGQNVRRILPEFDNLAAAEIGITEGIRSDGVHFPVEVSIGHTGTSTADLRIAIIRDITRRVDSARRLVEQQEELSRASRLAAAGEMAAALAHELHQPLSAIRNYARAAHMQPLAGSVLPGKIEKEAARAAAVVQRLRDFFRSGTSKLETMRVGALVENALAPMRDVVAQHGITIETRIDNPHTDVLIDRIQIETAIHSLINNAVEAFDGHAGGRHTVMVSTQTQQDGWVRLSIADSGPGIASNMSGRVFEPFATTKTTGTGMGLAMSRSMIEAHGGRIWFESKPDTGTIFHFTLPSTALNEAVA